MLDREEVMARNETPFKSALIIMGRMVYGSGDYLRNGLSLLLGPENVHCYPSRPLYDIEYNVPGSVYYMSRPHLWMDRIGSNESLEEIHTLFRTGSIDLALVCSYRDDVMHAFREIEDLISAQEIPVVSLDGGDTDAFNEGAIASMGATIVMKRDAILPEVSGKTKIDRAPIVPCPFSVPDQLLDWMKPSDRKNLKYDVMGAFNPKHHGSRPGIIKALQGCKYVKMVERSRWREYFMRQRESRIGVSIRGAGRGTHRYWETACNTVLAADDADRWMDNPLCPDVECVLYKGPEHLIRQLERFLDLDKVSLDNVHWMGFEALKKYHTNTARALRMLNLLESTLRPVIKNLT